MHDTFPLEYKSCVCFQVKEVDDIQDIEADNNFPNVNGFMLYKSEGVEQCKAGMRWVNLSHLALNNALV